MSIDKGVMEKRREKREIIEYENRMIEEIKENAK